MYFQVYCIKKEQHDLRLNREPYVRWDMHRKPIWEGDIPAESKRIRSWTLQSRRNGFQGQEMASEGP